MTDKVTYEVTDAVATITIRRPEVRNAMDLDVFEGLLSAGRRAGDDQAARAVVVTGEGGTFSSGIDTSVFTGGGGGDQPASVDIARLQRAFTVFELIPKPVIAAVGGPCFGAGIQLAAACDLRIAATDVQFSVMEVRWGIIPDLGGIHRLARLIGVGRTKELAFTTRRVGAEEAERIGLISRTAAPGELFQAAHSWARELAAGPPLALAGIKRLANLAFDVPVATGLQREAATQRRILASFDFIEAVSARVQEREPVFQAR